MGETGRFELPYRLLFDCHPQPMWVYDRETLAFLAVNDAAVAGYGYAREEFLAMSIRDIRPVEDVPDLLEIIATSYTGARHSGLWRHRRKDGTLIVVEIESHAITTNGRETILVMATDVTERIESMQALAESEERYREVFEADLTANYISTVDGRVLACNETFARMFGFASTQEALSSSAFVLYHNPEDRAAFVDLVLRHRRIERIELVMRRRDGSTLHIVESAIGSFDEHGALEQITGFVYDNTRHKRLEEQLAHAQKMEAVGRLAGGVAHDFNNMLTVISGYGDIVSRGLRAADPLQRELCEIRAACDKATGLTRQLLAFSRKQVTQPRPASVSAIVADMERMVARLVGENVDVQLALDPHLWKAKVDRGQFEQVVMNLGANARDAMDGVGTLTIETRNVVFDEEDAALRPGIEPGEHVMLAVTDTGCGMDEATRAHIFEPFFTTKAVGQGTGLGLATVYGIVTQSGGTIWVHSEVGAGTSFEIYLPRTCEPAPELERVALESQGPPGSETILLVEDEDGVRRLAAATLRMAGYTVLEAENGAEALALSEGRAEPIDLVVTDIVMPGMDGRELVRRLDATRCDVPVLYMSGYTGASVIDSDMLSQHRAFLEKPFTPAILATRVREVLDAPRR
jgi:PAS domain S-box-containing protein